jgi:hypothetical protein
LTFSQANISMGQISSSPTPLIVALQPGPLLFEPKTSSKTVSLNAQVRDLLPFGSPLGPPSDSLDHLFPMLIYMICSSQSKTYFPRETPIPRVSTLNSIHWSLMSLTTLPSGSMIPSKTPLFGPTTKTVLTLRKVATIGYSP